MGWDRRDKGQAIPTKFECDPVGQGDRMVAMQSFIIIFAWRLQAMKAGDWVFVGCVIVLLYAFKMLIVNPILDYIHRETFL